MTLTHRGVSRITIWAFFSCTLVILSSCLARRREVAWSNSTATRTLQTADKATLLEVVRNQYDLIQTLAATVDMVRTRGINVGKKSEQSNCRGYIVLQDPGAIRIIGFYPRTRCAAFDLASNDADLQMFPPQNPVIAARNNPATESSVYKMPSRVLLDALLIRPPGPKELPVVEDFTDEHNAVYVLHLFYYGAEGQLHLARDIWFGRSKLQMTRQTTFDPDGEILTNVRYTDWKTYDEVPFPRIIDIRLPKGDYGVVITVLKAEFNKPFTWDRFTAGKLGE